MFWDELPKVFDHSWALLQRGVVDAKSPFHLGAFSTNDQLGPSTRMVVLRKIDRLNRHLICYSDTRTHKIEEIQASPHVAWLFWHDRQQLQIRFKGTANILKEGDVVDDHWNNISSGGKKNYSSKIAPGQQIDHYESGVNSYERRKEVETDTQERWKDHFAVIQTEVSYMEWLWLNREGHRRAQFKWKADEEWESSWIVP